MHIKSIAPTVLLALGMFAPVFAQPATLVLGECEPKTTHHEVYDEEGNLIGIQTVKTTRTCQTYTSYHAIPGGN